jgi:hypothetical protein
MPTNNPTAIEVTLDGEVIRELTVAELNQIKIDGDQIAILKEQAQAKADARQSALAKLADLGLTQDEINAL